MQLAREGCRGRGREGGGRERKKRKQGERETQRERDRERESFSQVLGVPSQVLRKIDKLQGTVEEMISRTPGCALVGSVKSAACQGVGLPRLGVTRSPVGARVFFMVSWLWCSCVSFAT